MIVQVVVPEPSNFSENVEELKGIGMKYNDARKCWWGEADADDLKGVAIVIGEFEYEALRHWGTELNRAIDASCDFTIIGRKNH